MSSNYIALIKSRYDMPFIFGLYLHTYKHNDYSRKFIIIIVVFSNLKDLFGKK